MPGAFPRPMSSSTSLSPSCDVLRRATWVGTSIGGPLLSTPWESRHDRLSLQSRCSRGSPALPCIPCSPGRGSSTSTMPGRFTRAASAGVRGASSSGTSTASPLGSRSSGGSRWFVAVRSIGPCYRTLARAAGSLSRSSTSGCPPASAPAAEPCCMKVTLCLALAMSSPNSALMRAGSIGTLSPLPACSRSSRTSMNQRTPSASFVSWSRPWKSLETASPGSSPSISGSRIPSSTGSRPRATSRGSSIS